MDPMAELIARLNETLRAYAPAAEVAAAPVQQPVPASAPYAQRLADPVVVDVRDNGRPVNAGGYFIKKSRAVDSFGKLAAWSATGKRERINVRVPVASVPTAPLLLAPAAPALPSAAERMLAWVAANGDAARMLAVILAEHVGREHTYRDLLALGGIVPARTK